MLIENAFQVPMMDDILLVIIASFIMALIGFFLIRISGKKSVSQMTLPQLVVMISLGSYIISPLQKNDTIIGVTIGLLVFIVVLLLLEYLSMLFKWAEPAIDSKPTVLVANGKLIVENLDQLEARLREKGISSLSELRTCTMETSGNIGYEKMANYNPQNNQNFFDEIRNMKNSYPIDEQLD
jgi:uncharacterized membrane protein YcaP (DUF421 family)